MDSPTILYIHGMGGGRDSRIPSILHEYFSGVVVRTYDFDPFIAQAQISSWIDELKPRLIMGESLGANHALSLRRSYPSIPIILVSPALNAPMALEWLAGLALIPGVTGMLDKKFKPRPGERQKLHFTFSAMRKWRGLRTKVLGDYDKSRIFAFFGTRDHYRRSGIVSLRLWKRKFPADSFALYDGTHFMEEEYVRTILVQKIHSTLAD